MNYIEYPDIDDKNFFSKINNKKEFSEHGLKKIKKSAEELCDTENFGLFPHQIFIRNYLSPYTHYDGILLFHGVGVGKTCAAVTLAESHKKNALSYNKKIIVILDKSVKENFINTIHRILEIKDNKIVGENQCTGDTYKNYSIYDNLQDKIKKRKKLLKKYYNIYTYGKFTNFIIKNRFNFEMLKELFSDTVIIVDEVHNLREHDSEDIKRYDALRTALFHAKNSRLVLLSATPMFDQPQEIVSLANLFICNNLTDNETVTDIYVNNELTDTGMKYYKKYENQIDTLLHFIYNKKINIEKVVDKRLQQIIINLFTIQKNIINDDDVFTKNGELKNKKLLIQKLKGYVSYVKGDNKVTFPEKIFPTSSKDFKIFNKIKIIDVNMSKQHLIRYKEEISKNKVDINRIRQLSNINFIDSYNIEDFKNKNISPSTKYNTIVTNIKSSEGLVFIYSEYIEYGLNVIQKLLEYNGYSKYKSSKSKNSYTLLKGDSDIETRNNILKVFNSPENKNGEIIKILIGSKIFKEGISLMNVRQIHIVEPWHNLSRIEQVIGRGVRNCSHINLPKSKRNISIFLYASTFNNMSIMNIIDKTFSEVKDYVSYDMYAYLKSEDKQKKIDEVIKLLRSIAIDCIAHKDYNDNKTDDIICLNDDVKHDKIDTSTYNDSMDKPMIDFTINIIKNIFKNEYFITKDILLNNKFIKNRTDINDSIIDKTLYYILNKNKHTFIDSYNRECYVIRRDDYYILQPLSENNKQLSMYERMNPKIVLNKHSLKTYNTLPIETPFSKTTGQKRLIIKNEQIIKKKIVDNYEFILLDDSLKIRDISKDDKLDQRKIIRGKMCLNFNTNELVQVLTKLNIDYKDYINNNRIIRGKKKVLCDKIIDKVNLKPKSTSITLNKDEVKYNDVQKIVGDFILIIKNKKLKIKNKNKKTRDGKICKSYSKEDLVSISTELGISIDKLKKDEICEKIINKISN